ncbi:hypothetical protein SG09_22650 [Bradyrhizobium ottawaense]|nr:hypothetical protein SG09_22650 [Bradyrhizobium ottawaense]GMO74078.1 hypothetical protein BwSG10_36890 [Bradyrhizobium ottawaense]GMP01913.1 hypothetical protein BwDG23_36890 [Bradyrhizobium ottawaense]
MIACSTIAVGSVISAKSTPIRISPPAMPNSPDRNAVATISNPRAAIMMGVTWGISGGGAVEQGTQAASLPRPVPTGRGG